MKRKKSKSQWYLIVDMFDEATREIIDVRGAKCVIEGFLNDKTGTPSAQVVSVPPDAFSGHMSQDLLDYFHGNFGTKMIVLSHNIQLARLKPIPESVAKAIMEKAAPPLRRPDENENQIHVETTVKKEDDTTSGAQEEQASEQRQDIREEGRQPTPGDL